MAGTQAGRPQVGPFGEGSEFPPELARLPSGRHGLPREFIARNQRERLIEGLIEAVEERGYAAVTLADIARHAAVSRRTFYEHFSSKDECFAAAYDAAMGELQRHVSAGLEEADDWPLAVKAGIGAMLRFLAAEPAIARLCMVEAPLAGPLVFDRHNAAIRGLVPCFRAGRERCSPEAVAYLSPTTEEALIGGLLSLISRRVSAGQVADLECLLPDLVEFALTPYMGPSEAAESARQV